MHRPHFWSPVSDRITNTKWANKIDPDYQRISLGRIFGGYMPGRVQAKDMSTTIGNRSRLMDRKTGKLVS